MGVGKVEELNALSALWRTLSEAFVFVLGNEDNWRDFFERNLRITQTPFSSVIFFERHPYQFRGVGNTTKRD